MLHNYVRLPNEWMILIAHAQNCDFSATAAITLKSTLVRYARRGNKMDSMGINIDTVENRSPCKCLPVFKGWIKTAAVLILYLARTKQVSDVRHHDKIINQSKSILNVFYRSNSSILFYKNFISSPQYRPSQNQNIIFLFTNFLQLNYPNELHLQLRRVITHDNVIC